MNPARFLRITSAMLLLPSCTALRAPVPIEALPTTAERRDQYQVWSRGTPQVLIALRTTPDSVSGVPYWKSPTCDSCRVAIPRSAVDSVRVSGFDPNKTLLATIIIVPMVVLMIAFRGMGDPNY